MARKSSPPEGQETVDVPEAQAFRFEPAQIEDLLLNSEILGGELVPQGSNYTFAVRMAAEDFQFWGIYKPANGERPLWISPMGRFTSGKDVPFGESSSRVAPRTSYGDSRSPHGEGSMQLCVPYDGKSNYFTLRAEECPELVLLAAFDIMVNNTDRKGGHCFKSEDGRVWELTTASRFMRSQAEDCHLGLCRRFTARGAVERRQEAGDQPARQRQFLEA